MTPTTHTLKRKAEIALTAARYSQARFGDKRHADKIAKLDAALAAMQRGVTPYAALDANGALQYVE